ncbi:MAG TPA: segregation/condensation protein A [Armatimonadota bacterium]|nr:segregation/condensation protein A [Armatimonadota bacterium]
MQPKVNPIEQLELFGGPRVTISIFEGPLDLLLHLVRRQEVDIYELRIAEITGEYLRMLGAMADLNIEVSGEFLVLASTLCLLKSRLLLPATEAEVDEDAEQDEIDPQEDLAKRLAEYRVFKEAADALEDARQTRQKIYLRAENVDPDLHSGPIMLDDVSVFDLVTVFQDLLSRASDDAVLQVPRETVTVRDRIHAITEMLADGPEAGLTFYNLVAFPTTRIVIVMTFLAVLELIRRSRVTVTQDSPHGEIYMRLISRHGSVPPLDSLDGPSALMDDE